MTKYSSIVLLISIWISGCSTNSKKSQPPNASKNEIDVLFTPPDTSKIPNDDFGVNVRYGRELIMNTAYYIGPNGTVGKYLGNKMNCKNCHLDAGTRPYGFNFFSTHARYPQYRGRENRILTLAERINNCIERPHSGKPLPLDSKEMVAMLCYMKWLATNVPVNHHVKGDEMPELEYPNRAADPNKGAAIYAAQCSSCHGKEGQGQWNIDSSTYIYPPLWGAYAYQKGSSMHRVLKAARFIKANMPDKKASWKKPTLTDDEAIDVSAFINDDRIHIRPEKKNNGIPDYQVSKVKAIDYGKGPFVDTFSEMQHKFGPYKPIIEYHKAHDLPVNF
ncbi:MAG: c-type cytochrome [Bacteroidota bacterium]